MECVEFWMGHVTDPNHYDKLYLDKSYVLTRSRLAEKCLNIVSGAHAGPQLHNVEELIDQIVKNKPTCEKLGEVLATKIGARLAPLEI